MTMGARQQVDNMLLYAYFIVLFRSFLVIEHCHSLTR